MEKVFVNLNDPSQYHFHYGEPLDQENKMKLNYVKQIIIE